MAMDASSDRLTRADYNAMMRAHHRDCIAHGEDVEFHTWALGLLVDEPEEATFDLAGELCARRERLTGRLLKDAANYRRREAPRRSLVDGEAHARYALTHARVAPWPTRPQARHGPLVGEVRRQRRRSSRL